eukprot:CAMPEP_0113620334 /NCGR_PEP_ID=MMETSP0017_2-20120614/10360_1 /TAXON_ID=2856 /ORGANISM="Cylindrotheca closterium" /LENGTH=154 /DNA_ID=CAMNT_0000529993 /DNA_START=176 /DNA_END=640 /DNA_ORIENTATION=- /assembly_acc=CAM_ASM_000147
MSQAPSLPRRQSSRGMGFRRVPSSFTMDHEGGMANAKFNLGQTPGSSKKPSLFEKFGLTVSPSASEFSRKTSKTRASTASIDTPLTIPRRIPSQQSFGKSPSRRKMKNVPSMSKIAELSSSLKNAKFDNSNHSANSRKSKNPVQRYFSNNPLRI